MADKQPDVFDALANALRVGMGNSVTTASGGALAVLNQASQVGFQVPQTRQEWIQTAISLLLFLVGLFAKDATTGSKPSDAKPSTPPAGPVAAALAAIALAGVMTLSACSTATNPLTDPQVKQDVIIAINVADVAANACITLAPQFGGTPDVIAKCQMADALLKQALAQVDTNLAGAQASLKQAQVELAAAGPVANKAIANAAKGPGA